MKPKSEKAERETPKFFFMIVILATVLFIMTVLLVGAVAIPIATG
jgi:hypothetical protein